MPPPTPKTAKEIPDKETRIRYMVKLMTHGHWVTGVTGGDLADYWRMSDDTMKHDAGVASRRVREMFDAETIEQLKAQAFITHQSIRDRALRMGQLVVAERANENYVKMAGLAAPVQHAVQTDLGKVFADLLAEPKPEPDGGG